MACTATRVSTFAKASTRARGATLEHVDDRVLSLVADARFECHEPTGGVGDAAYSWPPDVCAASRGRDARMRVGGGAVLSQS